MLNHRYAKKKSVNTVRSLIERELLQRLNSPFIVGYVDYFEEEYIFTNIVLEYCEVNFRI